VVATALEVVAISPIPPWRLWVGDSIGDFDCVD
jgi:hypothetical protein